MLACPGGRCPPGGEVGAQGAGQGRGGRWVLARQAVATAGPGAFLQLSALSLLAVSLRASARGAHTPQLCAPVGVAPAGFQPHRGPSAVPRVSSEHLAGVLLGLRQMQGLGGLRAGAQAWWWAGPGWEAGRKWSWPRVLCEQVQAHSLVRTKPLSRGSGRDPWSLPQAAGVGEGKGRPSPECVWGAEMTGGTSLNPILVSHPAWVRAVAVEG